MSKIIKKLVKLVRVETTRRVIKPYGGKFSRVSKLSKTIQDDRGFRNLRRQNEPSKMEIRQDLREKF